MKKSFSKKLMILAFAFGGLFLIGNNVLAFADISNGTELNATTSSACDGGVYGITMYDANNECFCLHDPEGNGRECKSTDNLIIQ